MGIIDAIILGVVEGITEFLPISSTGHLILTSHFLGIESSDFLSTFEIFIQLGAILAVIIYYARTLLRNIEVWKRIIVAVIPTVIIGVVMYDVIKMYLLDNVYIVLFALIGGGVALIILEYRFKEKGGIDEVATLSYSRAALIGTIQALAIVPGVSRAAATMIGGMGAGLTRKAAVEFSFLLAIPTIAGASFFDLIQNIHVVTVSTTAPLAVGFAVSGIVAFFSISFLLSFVRTHTLIPFGIYRIVLAILILFILAQ